MIRASRGFSATAELLLLSFNLQAAGLIVLSDANVTIRQGKLIISDAYHFHNFT